MAQPRPTGTGAPALGLANLPGSSVFTGSPTTPHDALLQIGAELVAVAVTTAIAGSGVKAGHAMVALWLLLWVLLLITHYG